MSKNLLKLQTRLTEPDEQKPKDENYKMDNIK